MSKWYSVKETLPDPITEVLCYWYEYGEHVYVLCKYNVNRKMFEGSSVTIGQPEVTHWKYLDLPINYKPKKR